MKNMLIDHVFVRVTIAVMQNHDQINLGEKGLFHSRFLQHFIQSSAGRKLQAGSDAEAM